MNLKQVTLNNSGMQQDLSISKDGKDFAYKNVNIRIQATGDGTLASVTNIPTPSIIAGTDGALTMEGRVLNSILCGNYIVVFTHSENVENPDHIYRIDLKDAGVNDITLRTLYEGNLNFKYNKMIDSTFYYENDKVQKVYWVDGWETDGNNNYPRVINIITEGERNGGSFTPYSASTNFDFYPEIKYVPTISAIKNFDVPSELPAGMIQYFVSFFNKNQSETLIAAGTSLYSIDLKDRGSKADSTGCAFNVTVNIQNESATQGEWASSYEYVRLYSVRRTSLNGDATVNIVKDFKITTNVTSYTVLDNGIGQETIDPGQIFFVGGTPLFAKTLCQKDNTLFVGGIKTEGVLLDNVKVNVGGKDITVKEAITRTIVEHKDEHDNITLEEARILTENTKVIPVSDDTFNAYYPYKFQKDNESIATKTFKVGEIYRFGIQFQTKQGQWSEVVWIGDKKIHKYPTYNNGTFAVSNIRFYTDSATPDTVYPIEEYDIYPHLTDLIDDYCDIFTAVKNAGFVNYRLVMADPEYSNGRSIIAQGVVCPTMFVPSLRTQNAPHTINSWIMRPRNGSAPYHHLEPLERAKYIGSELSTYDPKEMLDPSETFSETKAYYTRPFEFIQADSSEYQKTSTDNNFYIDESIVSLFSPEISNDTVVKGTPKFRIIGYAPLTSNYSNLEIKTKNIGIDLDYIPGIDTELLKKYRTPEADDALINPLYSDYLYLAPEWWLQSKLFTTYKALYNIHMWHHDKSLVGFSLSDDRVVYPSDTQEIGVELIEEPLLLDTNSFYNHLFSKYNTYLSNPKEYDLNLGIGFYNSADDLWVSFKTGSADVYGGSLEYLHENTETTIYSVAKNQGQAAPNNKTISAISSIKYNSTAHAVFYLGFNEYSQYRLLPAFNDETTYDGIFTGKYPSGLELPNLIKPVWKNIETSSSVTNAEITLRNYFERNLNSVGSKLGAAWIDNFAFYENSTDVGKVYDRTTSKYKTCCVVSTSVSQGENFENKFRTLIRNAYSNNILTNYNYTENINGVDCTVLMAYDNGGNLLKKCYWSDINNIDFVEIDNNEFELNKSYPYLYSVTWNYVDIWEGRSPLPSSWKYKFVYPYREYDVSLDRWVVKGNVKDLDTFPIFSGEYIYNQDVINEASPSKPYIFVGELYYDIPYSDLYGGYSEEDLSKLTWVPISKTTKLFDGDRYYVGYMGKVDKTEGDTYYQRWDCLKTFPRTTEDINQVVDITSFMVETHINLDERTDPNRANFNMVVNPTNFNLFNGVYNQKNNLFSYTTINGLMSEENSHQVSWSLTKNITGTVDTWTNITTANTVNLKHPVTKLVNFNNKVVGLTEHSVEIVNFNARNLVPTDDNTFIELKNSAKVDGTIDFTVDKGTRNMSVLVTEAGLYFIDDNENSLIRINYNGEIKNLGTGRMDSWFKQNVFPGTYYPTSEASDKYPMYLTYDAKYKDVYICKCDQVLVYNEPLDSFTSFVDYEQLVSLFTDSGITYAIGYDTVAKENYIYELYGNEKTDTCEGWYGYGFYSGGYKHGAPKGLPYSIQYRVNPGPYSDKVFTNIEFKADLDVSKENKSTSNDKPFDYIQAWTEYQDTGRKPLEYDRLNNLREKFRTWRVLIPRNEGTRDRIRNPWMHLKLDSETYGKKLEFHNISITYME